MMVPSLFVSTLVIVAISSIVSDSEYYLSDDVVESHASKVLKISKLIQQTTIRMWSATTKRLRLFLQDSGFYRLRFDPKKIFVIRRRFLMVFWSLPR